MKHTTIILLGILLILVCSASAAPTTYAVATTPLYASSFSTLTCNYIANDSLATAQYRWYDNGIWYNTNTATYSSLEDGHTYRCAVNLTRGGSSGWRNSTNSVTTAASCINPYPYMFRNTYGTLNLPSFIASSTTPNIIAIGGGYGTTTAHQKLVGNNSFIFYGSDYLETTLPLVRAFWMRYYNVMYYETATGDWTLTTAATDENLATFVSFSKLATSGTWYYSTYNDINYTIANGTALRIKFGLWSNTGIGSSSTYALEGYSGSTWYTLITQSNNALVETVYTLYATTTRDYTKLRVAFRMVTGGAGFTVYTKTYELEELNWTTGSFAGSVVTPSSFSLSNFSLTGGSTYKVWRYLDEQASIPMNFSSASALTTATLRTYCLGSVLDISLTNNTVNRTYLLGLKEEPNKLETYMLYDTGDTYYRRWVFCDAYKSFTWYMVNTALTTPRLYTFILTGEYTDWITGTVGLERYIGGNLKSIVSDNWDAAHQAVFYLVDNREYSITLMQDGCGTSRNIGWVTTNPASTTYTLSVSGTTYDLTHVADIYSHTFFRVNWDEATNQINMTFYDTANRTEWFWWGVYDAYDRSLVYSDNTTSHLYLGTYLANVSKKYYVQMIMSHPDGSIGRWWEGTVVWKGGYFANLDWIGETAGITSETFFMLVALGIVCLTALVGTPLSLPFTGTLVLFEIIVFSVLEWLPFYKNELAMLVLYMIAALVVVVSYNNSKGGK